MPMSRSEVQVFLKEMGMQQTIYMETFESLECDDIYYRYVGPHHPDGPTGLLLYFGACSVHPRGEDNPGGSTGYCPFGGN